MLPINTFSSKALTQSTYERHIFMRSIIQANQVYKQNSISFLRSTQYNRFCFTQSFVTDCCCFAQQVAQHNQKHYERSTSSLGRSFRLPNSSLLLCFFSVRHNRTNLLLKRVLKGRTTGIEPADNGATNHRLTTWLRPPY